MELGYSKDFTLRISDNGSGIPRAIAEKGKAGHFGLRGMKETASRVGAEFSLATSAASGTQITLRIPGGLIFKQTEPVMIKWLAKLRTLFRRAQR